MLAAVGFAIDAQVARGRALIDRGEQAGPEPAPARVVFLDFELAGAKLEDALKDLNGAAQGLGPGKGAVELDSAVAWFPGEIDPGKIFAGGDLRDRGRSCRP